MSESETKGRCRREFESYYADKQVIPSESDWILADAIDRLAADVAAIKERVDALSPEDVAHLLESEKAWVRLVEETRDEAIRERDEAREERDEARSEVERLRAELADAIDRITAVNAVVCDGSVEAERDRFFAGMGAAIKERDAATRERDEARAECDRLRAELAGAIRERDQLTRERDGWQEDARMLVANRDRARAECERLHAELAARPAAAAADGSFLSSWITRRNAVKGSDWNGNGCPACGGSRRIWFKGFHGWTCRCAKPGSESWWTDAGAVDEEWLNELLWRWKVDAVNSPRILDGSPEPRGWLTEDEKGAIEELLPYTFSGVQARLLTNLIARAGSPPVVEVPAMQRGGIQEFIHICYRNEINKAGISWKEVPRE